MDEENQNQTNKTPYEVADTEVNQIPAKARNSDLQDEQNRELKGSEEEEIQPRLPLRADPRGRPAQRADTETRDSVIALFQLMGPGVGLPVLQEIFSGVARRELEDLQRRYRDAHEKKNRVLIHTF